MGNQEAYDLWGGISTTVAGLIVPVGQTYTAAKAVGQTGKTLIGTVGKSVVKEVAQDALVGAASSKAGSLVMDVTGDANLSRLAGLGTGILSGSKTGKALNSIDNAVSSSVKTLNHIDDVADVTKAFDDAADSAKPIKSLSELMSPEDAAKYNTFLKNGSSASFTQSELKAFQKVDEAIALNKVNYDDVLQLRRNNVSIDDLAYDKYWYDKITSIPKGSRPDPSNYLDQEYMDLHLAQFDEGLSVIQTEWAYSRYSETNGFVGVPDDNTLFVMPKNYCDDVVAKANGDISVIEKVLGFPDGYFSDGGGLVRIDVDDIAGLNIRMPSGNETGANKLWIPGGYTSGGVPEAISDTIPLSRTNITRIEIN